MHWLLLHQQMPVVPIIKSWGGLVVKLPPPSSSSHVRCIIMRFTWCAHIQWILSNGHGCIKWRRCNVSCCYKQSATTLDMWPLLRTIDVRHNQMQPFPTAIGNKHCQFTAGWQQAVAVPSGLTNLIALSQLGVSHNFLSEVSFSFRRFSNMTKLLTYQTILFERFLPA